jgi:protein-L-isoaspartate(D-aspartate) O-methyltransferase
MDDYAQKRRVMIDTQLRSRDIVSERVLRALDEVPRHLFVPADAQHLAYEDQALPIADGQTISQPYIVALMAQTLELQPDDVVLDIGTGSGYAAAVLSRLGRYVYTVERQPELARTAAERLRMLGYTNVDVHTGDGTRGLPEHAPYNAIAVAAAAPWVPAPLRDQLADGGRLVIPVGGANEQVLLLLRRRGDEVRSMRLSGVRFVPLVGNHAWEQPPAKE